MTIETKDGFFIDLEEYDIRRWFMATPLDEAKDTLNVVTGIVDARKQIEPKRNRRSGAGTTKQIRFEGAQAK